MFHTQLSTSYGSSPPPPDSPLLHPYCETTICHEACLHYLIGGGERALCISGVSSWSGLTGVEGGTATLALLLDGANERFDGEGLASSALVCAPPIAQAHQFTVHAARHLSESRLRSVLSIVTNITHTHTHKLLKISMHTNSTALWLVHTYIIYIFILFLHNSKLSIFLKNQRLI